jgi:hypothetical protein
VGLVYAVFARLFPALSRTGPEEFKSGLNPDGWRYRSGELARRKLFPEDKSLRRMRHF